MKQKNQRAAIPINFRCPPDIYDEIEKLGRENFPTPWRPLDFNQGKTVMLLIKAGIEAINNRPPLLETEKEIDLEQRVQRLEDLLIGDGK